MRLNKDSCFPVTSPHGRLGILSVYCILHRCNAITLTDLSTDTHTQGEHITSHSRVDRTDWKCDTVIFNLMQM